jgi:cobalamin-5-phosphate synthase
LESGGRSARGSRRRIGGLGGLEAGLVAATGALHEDGLADVADGFGGGRTREQKLALMRDSRIGAYGAVARMLALITRVAAPSPRSSPRSSPRFPSGSRAQPAR